MTRLRERGAAIIEVELADKAALTQALAGVACVVSALSGLRDVIVDTQTHLLAAAGTAGVPRFIPSDFAIDFTKLPAGNNRNLDLRREFGHRLDESAHPGHVHPQQHVYGPAHRAGSGRAVPHPPGALLG
ncbi:MAG: NmrA family NAD(P)-binding protein [Hymenobacter sp.]